jgi:PAS domain S-box-containing protein
VQPNGDVRIVHSRGEVIWDEQGRPHRLFGMMQDITELRHAESELRASEARFRTFVDHATDGFLLMDDQLTIVDVNRQACESLGYSREELIGRRPRDFDTGMDEQSRTRVAERVSAGKRSRSRPRTGARMGPCFRWRSARASSVQGEQRLRLALVRDISERKRAEAEHQAHVWFLESMDRVNRAMQGTADLEQMMSNVLDVVLDVFASDRALLVTHATRTLRPGAW